MHLDMQSQLLNYTELDCTSLNRQNLELFRPSAGHAELRLNALMRSGFQPHPFHFYIYPLASTNSWCVLPKTLT